jgi:alanine racemase
MQPPERTLTLRPRVTTAQESLRPTRAEIDLDALVHNLGVVRAEAGGARVLAVVKADAYGHGVVPVVARLAAEGVAAFGVALAEEGLELREAGIDAPILVLNGVYAGAHREGIARGVDAQHLDLPARGAREPEKNLEQRALARAVGPEQGRAPGRHREGDVVERRNAAVSARE